MALSGTCHPPHDGPFFERRIGVDQDFDANGDAHVTVTNTPQSMFRGIWPAGFVNKPISASSYGTPITLLFATDDATTRGDAGRNDSAPAGN